jgi:hypothetical protein
LLCARFALFVLQALFFAGEVHVPFEVRSRLFASKLISQKPPFALSQFTIVGERGPPAPPIDVPRRQAASAPPSKA